MATETFIVTTIVLVSLLSGDKLESEYMMMTSDIWCINEVPTNGHFVSQFIYSVSSLILLPSYHSLGSATAVVCLNGCGVCRGPPFRPSQNSATADFLHSHLFTSKAVFFPEHEVVSPVPNRRRLFRLILSRFAEPLLLPSLVA